MSWILIVEQSLNGLQFGLMLFLLAAGLTLVFGIMDMINLAHGSLYMLGAFLAATLVQATGSFAAGVLLAIPATALLGMLLEMSVLRTLYARDHLSQVLATFALILILNEAVRIIWGPDMPLSVPAALSGPVQLLPGMVYPAYRLLIIGVGAAVAGALYLLVARTRIGMLVRAGASNREMALAMGVNIPRLFTLLFGVGAGLCAVAGALLGPLFAVQVGMGENILILAFVVIVIGGIGSIRGALVGSLLVGVVDTIGRAFLPLLFGIFFQPRVASAAGPAIASVLVYLLMAVVLYIKPQGLFPARGYGDAPRRALGHSCARSRFSPGDAGGAPDLLLELCQPHLRLRARRDQPQPDPWVRRNDLLRPRRLRRHRCLRVQHPALGRRRERMDRLARCGRGFRPGGARDRRGIAAHARRVLHHDHARLRADDVLPGELDEGLRGRRGPESACPRLGGTGRRSGQ